MLVSPALNAALALTAGLAAALTLAAVGARAAIDLARTSLSQAAAGAAPDDAATALPMTVLAVTAPIAIAAAAAALLGQVAAARGLWIPRREVRGAPGAGADPTTAGQRAAEAAIALVRVAILLAVAASATASALEPLARAGADPAAHLAIVGRAVATVAIAAVAVAALELVVRWRRLEGNLAMTDAERRAEQRELSGDPRLRAARRAARADERIELGQARVVIVADDAAVAIGWRPGAAPHRLVRGRGLVARRISAAARAVQVPLVADAALAEALHDAEELDAHLPALAAVLAAIGVSAPR